MVSIRNDVGMVACVLYLERFVNWNHTYDIQLLTCWIVLKIIKVYSQVQ